MKKMMMALAAVIMISSSAMAQEQNGQRPERKMDRNEMIKHRTDRMVKDYGLNEEQGKKLLELNTSFADKMPGARGNRGERPSREEMEAQREKMRATMDAYNAELKNILTEEQFSKYQEDSKKFRNGRGQGRGGRGQGRGSRGPRQDNE